MYHEYQITKRLIINEGPLLISDIHVFKIAGKGNKKNEC